jgi:hypothetical protein
MRTNRHPFAAAIAGASLLAGAGIAAADDDARGDSGITLVATAGVEDFTGHTMRQTSNLGGLWGVHTAIGVQKYVSLEAAYVGSASKINAPLGNDAATLVGTTFQGIARITPLPDLAIRPYAFFGGAWRHYEVAGEDFTTAASGMIDSTDLFQLPVGAGVAYQYGAVVADMRFTYRQTAGESLLLERDGEEATMNTWGVTAGLGFEF